MAAYLFQFGSAFWQLLAEMAPYLLLGFAVAGLLSVWISPATVERHLGKGNVAPVAKAALFGVPLPLCSCGVIPVSASLRRHGASRGATTSFLLSTPQTGVDSILVTWSLLGPFLAIFRPLIALVTGLIGGLIVNRIEPADTPSSTTAAEATAGTENGRSLWRRAFDYGFITLPRDIARSLVVGLLIAGVIAVLVPEGWLGEHLGRGWLPKLVMMAVGIPLYVCATASVPVAAALITKGVSPGAALVFLIAGPATNAATVSTVWKILGRRVAIVYLAVVACSALGFGALLDWFAFNLVINEVAAMHQHGPGLLHHLSAVLLVAVLVGAFTPRSREGGAAPAGDGHEELIIKGMTCRHCAQTVRAALLASPGVRRAEVDHQRGRAVLTGERIDLAAARAAVERAGYEVMVSDRS